MDYKFKKNKPARFDYKSEIALDLKQNQTKTTQQYFELVGIMFRISSVKWCLCRSDFFFNRASSRAAVKIPNSEIFFVNLHFC